MVPAIVLMYVTGAAAAVGDITTFIDPTGNVSAPEDIATGPDGSLWFTSFGNGSGGSRRPVRRHLLRVLLSPYRKRLASRGELVDRHRLALTATRRRGAFADEVELRLLGDASRREVPDISLQ
jgi:streptogramin lyase